MDEEALIELLHKSAQKNDREFRCLSIRAQASRMGQLFRRSVVVMAIYPAQDGATGFQHIALKGTAERLVIELQRAEQTASSFRTPQPTWTAFLVEDHRVALATRDAYELRLHETARDGKPSRMTKLYWEELTPGGREKYRQTNILGRYTRYVRGVGLTLRKIRV